MAAAAACRGSTSSGGTGCCQNVVLVRNTADRKSCNQICGQTIYKICDAEVSIHGKTGKATMAGEKIGAFYNYRCKHSAKGGSEVSSSPTDINRFSKDHTYYSFCCCRKQNKTVNQKKKRLSQILVSLKNESSFSVRNAFVIFSIKDVNQFCFRCVCCLSCRFSLFQFVFRERSLACRRKRTSLRTKMHITVLQGYLGV